MCVCIHHREGCVGLKGIRIYLAQRGMIPDMEPQTLHGEIRPCTVSPNSYMYVYRHRVPIGKMEERRFREGPRNLKIRPRATQRPNCTVALEAGHRFNWSLGRGMAKFDVSWPFPGPNFRPKIHFEDKSEQFYELGRDF